ncbi:hypothetical protein [Thalassolituus hydrocarboniclasticus]|uniref:YD repeat-containing protein n=1 Tax=Thalassolituus hydrocarboniclasticus TaxID=2742796 RepID=A0ABY6AAL7_9GAMM|nr:hypothetical protein [Thalassolituus hydrocarboniclasticus]UXD87697.1 hypothetical protein HUF19_09750 [Thalassolituus hydrocarboniclasticus]
MKPISESTSLNKIVMITALSILGGCAGDSSSSSGSGKHAETETEAATDNSDAFPDSSAELEILLQPADGVDEAVISARYDYRGLLIHKVTEDDEDKVQVSFEYNSNKSVTKKSEDVGADGLIDKVSVYTYSNDGNILSELADNIAGGTRVRYSYSYDAAGNRTRFIRDDNDDGKTDYQVDYHFNSSNLQTQIQTDSNGDGQPDRIQNFVYNDDLLKVREETDNNADGIADSIEYYQFDNNKRQTYTAYDGDNDGRMEREMHVVYDADSEETSFDNNGDGIIDRRVRKEYLPQETIHRFDNNMDAIYDQVDYRTFTSSGKRTYLGRDTNADGIIDRSNRCEFYGPGEAVTKITVDFNGDGVSDRTEVRSFSDDARLTDIQKNGAVFYRIDYLGEKGVFGFIDSPVTAEITNDSDCRG